MAQVKVVLESWYFINECLILSLKNLDAADIGFRKKKNSDFIKDTLIYTNKSSQRSLRNIQIDIRPSNKKKIPHKYDR